MGVWPPMLPADVVALAETYLGEKMTVAMGDSLPRTPDDATKPGAYLRIEFGGGTKANEIEYDLDTILHSYAPSKDEASLNSRTATAYMDAARGETIDGWFVGLTRVVSLPTHVDDPRFGTVLPRFRSMVTWRVTAQLITP